MSPAKFEGLLNRAMGEGGVIYFHGSSPEHDRDPSDLDVEAAGVDLVRHVRPGYVGSRARPEFDLQAAAAQHGPNVIDTTRLTAN